jgi:hypothetical protein
MTADELKRRAGELLPELLAHDYLRSGKDQRDLEAILRAVAGGEVRMVSRMMVVSSAVSDLSTVVQFVPCPPELVIGGEGD